MPFWVFTTETTVFYFAIGNPMFSAAAPICFLGLHLAFLDRLNHPNPLKRS